MLRLLTAAVTMLVAACSTLVPVATQDDPIVYLIQRDWHTEIGLPVAEIAGPLATMEKDFPGVRFLTFGFGERQFLMDRKVDLGSMLRALLPSRSALLMTALSATPEQAFGASNVVVLRVSHPGLDRIEKAIWHEFEMSADTPVRLAIGPYPGSAFYGARSTYHALNTCNTWTAEILREGGLPMPATGVLFAGQVMGMARWISTRQGASTKQSQEMAVLPR